MAVDGGTATLVSTAANGHQTVNIAPTVAGVSNNTYSSFNVGAAGASLNLVDVNIGKIVNQVTSANPSIISEPVDVIGPRANVADPNGIAINDGSFLGTCRVAPTAGCASFKDTLPVTGIPWRDLAPHIPIGTTITGHRGFASALVALDLIAKNGSAVDRVCETSSAVAGAWACP
ncbi:two-partner secretion domain-containing protein [Paraburkholderia gardini]|uniref:Filamentous haemagglutinin FhaB/tRNA nuclease CdiA-like TPS domain-containing protein n=1 Tax=Paraburkholderia gardini TaxID=2823469 RepID=A0ABM8UAC3_9BURK|nr:filamentous hemagglutinin N-terminal domain-containing protein [Paraburkholderia gardini]CAG4921069.1 hypothetical protein R54767_04777 [Paraburkholderia gardini]